MIFSLVILICVAVYAAFIFWCIKGWNAIEISERKVNSQSLSVDVVIAVRNEECVILNLLEKLIVQNYGKSNFKIVVVDDHSTDKTFEIASEFLLNRKELNSVVMKAEGVGKKSALAQAIRNSTANLILTTDGDCIVGESWIKSMVEPFSNATISFVAGPVVLSGGNGVFSLLQKMEMLGLIGIAGASIANRNAMMCNGANLCFKKSAYDSVQGYLGSAHASGDDTQLMRKLFADDPKKLLFVKSKNSVVKSSSLSSMNSFWQQRRRWATKIPTTLSFFTVFISVVAFFAHVGLLVELFLSFLSKEIAMIFITTFFLKVVAETLFLKKVGNELGQKTFPLIIIFIQPIYWLYITLVGFAVPFAKYEWKGRKVK